MAQDTGLFSIKRPRETLGNVQNYSSIPQASSALKRSSSAANLQNPPHTAQHVRSTSTASALGRPQQPVFNRTSSAGIDGGLSSVRRSVSSNLFHNTPMAPPSAPQLQRRSSVRSRTSTAAPAPHQSFFAQGPIPAGAPKDPRPLKDRGFQARISQELLDYLTQNNFELEMKHSLTQNTLKSPTQKDFNYIFQWLYHRIDPTYKFQKSIDAEVPPILKQLRYPYERSITKSQIAAVGGQNWSTFLGMLHWMMQLAQMCDKYYMDQYDHACAEAGMDVTGDRIIFRFLSNAYHDWLQGEEGDETSENTFEPHIRTMAAEFEQSNAKYVQEMETLEAENRELRDLIDDLEKNAPDITKLEKHFKLFQDDKQKFEEYNENVQAKIDKYNNRIAFLEEEVKKTDAELETANTEQSELQSGVDKQGISTQDIDRMNSERERLQKAVEDTTTKLEETHARLMEKESETNQRLEDLEDVTKRYNSLGYQNGLIPSSAVNAKDTDYELHLNINDNEFSSSQLGSYQNGTSSERDRLLADAFTGYNPTDLVDLDLRGTIRSNLMALRKEVNDRRKVAMDADMNHRDLLDNIKEAMDEKRSEVEALEHKRRAAEEEFERTKEITTTQKLASDAQIERMEKELARLRASLSESVQIMEQREINTNIEHEQLLLRANALREELHTNVESMLNDVIRFKVHIQKGLEDYESFVIEEVEQELGGEEEEEEARDETSEE